MRDYRKLTEPTPEEERQELKERAYLFTNQTNLARSFKTSVQNINLAFAGRNKLLMNKLKKYIINHEERYVVYTDNDIRNNTDNDTGSNTNNKRI